MTTVRDRSKNQVWTDVVFAIFLRHLKSQFSDKLGLGWSVVSPLFFIIGLSFVRGLIDGGDTHGIPTFFFMVYGILFVITFLNTVTSVSGAITANRALFAFRQVQPIAALAATALLDLLVKLIVALVIFLFSYLMQFEIRVDDPLAVIFCFFSAWSLAVSIGTLFALGGEFVPELHKIRTLIMRPVFFISGIFFSLQDIPEEYWHFLDWNPLLHAVELGRSGAYSFYDSSGLSGVFLAYSSLFIFTTSVIIYRLCWKQAISR